MKRKRMFSSPPARELFSDPKSYGGSYTVEDHSEKDLSASETALLILGSVSALGLVISIVLAVVHALSSEAGAAVGLRIFEWVLAFLIVFGVSVGALLIKNQFRRRP